MFGRTLKILSSKSTISCPMICGSSSSGYMANMQLFGHTGDVLIRTGCEWPSIWSFSYPSYLSKNCSVILAALGIYQIKYVLSCYYFFLVKVHVEQNLLCGSVWEWKRFGVELHEDSFVFFCLRLYLVSLLFDFTLVSNDIMFALLSKPISIDIRH